MGKAENSWFEKAKAHIIVEIIEYVSNMTAHSSNIIRANERLKMISTIIKSGYE